jgi:hypothetical protein
MIVTRLHPNALTWIAMDLPDLRNAQPISRLATRERSNGCREPPPRLTHIHTRDFHNSH